MMGKMTSLVLSKTCKHMCEDIIPHNQMKELHPLVFWF